MNIPNIVVPKWTERFYCPLDSTPSTIEMRRAAVYVQQDGKSTKEIQQLYYHIKVTHFDYSIIIGIYE